jgi:hypothetical protein
MGEPNRCNNLNRPIVYVTFTNPRLLTAAALLEEPPFLLLRFLDLLGFRILFDLLQCHALTSFHMDTEAT